MRHQMAHRKLGRTSAHRAALFRNQLASMIENERIITTLVKAKELRPIVEKMVTLGKNDSVHSRRMAARSLPADMLLQKLFETVSPRFSERPGGYTRIIKLGPRRGDGAEMAILEFVDYELKHEEPAGEKGKKKAAAPAAKERKEEPETETAEEKESGTPRRKRQAKAKAAPAKKPAGAKAKKPAAKAKSKGKKK